MQDKGMREEVLKKYPALTDELAKTNPYEYELGVLVGLIQEFNNGKKMKSKKILKSGTNIVFVSFLDESDKANTKKELCELIDVFKNTYNGWDLRVLFKE